MDPTTPTAEAPTARHPGLAALEELGRAYGFAQATPSALMASDPASCLAAVESARAAMESLARILAKGAGIPVEDARPLCGLRGQTSLSFGSPSELRGHAAAYERSRRTVRLCDRALGGARPGAHFGHEWAHAVDHALGSKVPGLAPQDPKPEPGAVFGRMAAEASASPAPYQAALGSLARDLADTQRGDAQYASVKLSGQRGSPASSLPCFAKLVDSMLPTPASALSHSARKSRLGEASSQIAKLAEFAREAAYESLAALPPPADGRRLAEPQLRALAAFCARAVAERSSKESSARRGREKAIDAAKSDIATMLAKALRIPAPEAAKAASSIFHIDPIKLGIGDPHFSAPYTGTATWGAAPGSLADLSCAMVRIFRNQRALAHGSLAKERFVPMAFWWSMRRHVSECAQRIDAHASGMLPLLAGSGQADPALSEHAELWRARRGEYKAGALVFSDLVGTGSKMILNEAAQAGRPIAAREALGLRRRIAAPINELSQRKTVFESLAESFEQFVISQAGLRTPLGKACSAALAAHLVDGDEQERSAAVDPSISWMNGKDGDVDGNRRRWRAVLRELPGLFPAARPARSKRPR